MMMGRGAGLKGREMRLRWGWRRPVCRCKCDYEAREVKAVFCLRVMHDRAIRSN